MQISSTQQLIRRCTSTYQAYNFFRSIRLTYRHHPHNLISFFISISPHCAHMYPHCIGSFLFWYCHISFFPLLFYIGALARYPLFPTEFLIVLFSFRFIASPSPLSSFEVYHPEKNTTLYFILNLCCSYIVNIRIFCDRTSHNIVHQIANNTNIDNIKNACYVYLLRLVWFALLCLLTKLKYALV